MYSASIAHRSHGPPPRRRMWTIVRRGALLCVAVATACLATSPAHADLSITDGAASFFWDTDNAGGAATADFVESFGGNDMQYAENWYLRYNGTTYSLSGATTQVGSGNAASVTFSGIASVPLQFEGFDVTISYQIADTGSQSHMHTSATVTNLSGTAQNVSLINYFDYDVPTIDDAGNNSAISTLNGDGVSIRIFNPGKGQIVRTGNGASHFQVANYAGLVNGIENGTITSLNDSTANFISGDFTGAIQWDVSVAGSGSSTVTGTVLGTTAFVPEPSMVSALAIMTVGLGVVGLRRRKRAKAQVESE